MRVNLTYQRCGIVLAPDGSLLEAEGVLNPGIVRDRGGTLLMYPRMVAPGNVSRVGLARAVESANGIAFEREGVVLEPRKGYERRSVAGGYGCEDPRVTFIPRLEVYVLAYTAFGPEGPRIALAISSDAHAWTRLGLIEFADDAFNYVPNKDGAFFPEIVSSPRGVPSFAFYHRPMLKSNVEGQAPIPLLLAMPAERREVMCIAYVAAERALRDVDGLRFVMESVRVLEVGERWGRLKNGAGTPPVKTSAGWLSVFHGVDSLERPGGGASLHYRAGLVLHDLERPHEVLYRSEEPFLRPQTPEERLGIVNDVVFPTGIDPLDEGRYDLYYGAADAKVARARIEVAFQDT